VVKCPAVAKGPGVGFGVLFTPPPPSSDSFEQLLTSAFSIYTSLLPFHYNNTSDQTVANIQSFLLKIKRYVVDFPWFNDGKLDVIEKLASFR
jgi:hypothetical protein